MAYSSNNRQEVVDKLVLNETNEIFVSKILDTDGNLVSVDIRTYFQSNGEEMTPTKKGVRLSVDNAKSLVGILEELLK